MFNVGNCEYDMNIYYMFNLIFNKEDSYRLKCSPSVHIKFFLEKVPPCLSKLGFNLEFSCHKSAKV